MSQNKYHIETSTIENKPGTWNSTLCEIYEGEKKIGEYKRNYPSYVKSTFVPFSFNGKDYALFSSDYSTISLMSLPDCKEVELKEECKKQLYNFCPTEIRIPEYQKLKDSKDKFEFIITKTDSDGFTILEEGYSRLGFALGCVWGDDSSWKLNLIDLSRVEENELWFINNKGEREWLYEEFPDKCKLSDIQVEFNDDVNKFPDYVQLKQKYVSITDNKSEK